MTIEQVVGALIEKHSNYFACAILNIKRPGSS